ncbi:hypothetical protein GCM10010145_58100 [Streptomyces ruber]|uniref:Uncharacterized protein n=2 Tax=Streptomyces TaxID=1883 RepID=A0A918BP94_9ACTN|nr:hypothetical protein GCM10010145_58100 [Streptomyces ruber]
MARAIPDEAADLDRLPPQTVTLQIWVDLALPPAYWLPRDRRWHGSSSVPGPASS